MDSTRTTPGSEGSARDLLTAFARVKAVSTVVIAVLGAAVGWFALYRIGMAARQFEVDLGKASALAQFAVARPWIACLPALGALVCGIAMLRTRGPALAMAVLLAAACMLALLAIVGVTVVEVLAPMYQYQPID